MKAECFLFITLRLTSLAYLRCLIRSLTRAEFGGHRIEIILALLSKNKIKFEKRIRLYGKRNMDL